MRSPTSARLMAEIERARETTRRSREAETLLAVGQESPLRDATDATVGTLSAIRDVTARKRTEEGQARLQVAIEKAAREWQLTFDAVESPILIVDGSGRIRRMNRAAKDLSGRSYRENIGQTVEAVGSSEPWRTMSQVVDVIRETRGGLSVQVREESSGKTWDVGANLAAGADVAEERIIVVARDVTGIVELQESLRRSQTMSAMGALVAGVAHEVRNPLFGISATLDAFEARFGAHENYQRYIDTLRRQVDRLSDLMRELLEYGKPRRMEFAEGSLEEVISQAVGACAALAERANVRIANMASERPGRMWMDRRRLLQVFENLLDNAIQHSPPGSVVTLEVEEFRQGDQPWWRCAVKDAGPGFRAEDLPRVFEPFFTRRRGGTGLGLSIVERIVEEHGGRISAANRPEGGAAVEVRLPLVLA